MIGAWNTDSGASVHAELIGRAWKEMGIDLQVFTFYRHSYHGTAFDKSGKRGRRFLCTGVFTVYGDPHPLIDTTPIVDADFDIFCCPGTWACFLCGSFWIFSLKYIKKQKQWNVCFMMEKLSKKPEYFRFDWDQVVCFDDRYYDFLKNAYPEGKLSIIPYPSFPLRLGKKEEARKKLGLPLDRKIVLMFGQAAEKAINTTMVLDRLVDKYDPMLLLVTEVEKVLEGFNRIKSKATVDINIVEESPGHGTPV